MKYHVAMFFHFQQYCKTDYSHDCKKPKGLKPFSLKPKLKRKSI